MLTVGSILTRAPATVAPEAPLELAIELMRVRKLRHLPVVEKERLVGVLSERDLLEHPRPAGAGRSHERVREHMSPAPETVHHDESAVRACRRMLERRIGCLPVLHGGRLAGVLTESDLLRLYVRVARAAGDGAFVDPRVGICMTRGVLTIGPRASAGEAFELCRAKGIRHLPVLDEGFLVGIVSDRNLLPVIGRGAGAGRTVEDIMTRDCVAVTGTETRLSEAVACMLRDGFHALPVVEHGVLKGIVTSADALLALGTLDGDVLESAWRSEVALAAEATDD
jgi:CBS domain-containing protein